MQIPAKLESVAGMVCVLLALAGCGRQSADAEAPAPAAVAIARGVIGAADGVAPISAQRDGQIVRVTADEGMHVRAGQTLALLDAERTDLLAREAAGEAARSSAAVRLAEARLKLAESEAARLRRLVAGDAATGQEADQARLAAGAAGIGLEEARETAIAADARARLAAFEQRARTIRSPIGGTILRRSAVVGASVSANTALFLVIADGPMVVRAEVDEAFADQVKPGMAARITDAGGGGPSYHAHVLRVSPALDAPTTSEEGSRADIRVLRVVLALDGPASLRLGQRVLARFEP